MGYFDELRPLDGHRPLLMVGAVTLLLFSVFILFICG